MKQERCGHGGMNQRDGAGRDEPRRCGIKVGEMGHGELARMVAMASKKE